MKVDVAFQCDGTCVECTFWNYNRTTTIQATCNDSLVDCFMAGSIRGVGFGAEVRNEIRLFGERCFLDLLFNLCTLLESLIEIIELAVANVAERSREIIPSTFFMRFQFYFKWLLDMQAKVRKVTLL